MAHATLAGFRTPGGGAEVKINLRARKHDRDLIDRAASVTRRTRTEFMMDSARRAAVDTLLDQTVFGLDDAGWERFMTDLNAPPEVNPRLRALLSRKAPWDVS